MSLYNKLEVKPCNILGFLHFEVCNGNITLGAFMYEKDAFLFKNAAEQSVQADKCLQCGATENLNHHVVCDEHDPFS